MEAALVTELIGDDWLGLLGNLLSDTEKQAILRLPRLDVSSAIKLSKAIGIDRTREVIRLSKVYPEINVDGRRRCVHSIGGKRCRTYSNLPICARHFESANMLSPSTFKSEALRAAYMRNLANPRKLQTDSELAVMRTMLEMLLSKANEQGNMPIEMIGAVSALSEKITVVADRMSKMQEITPEKVETMMERIVDIISEYVPAEKLKECADKISSVSLSQPSCAIDYLPGDTVVQDRDGNITENQITTVHQRALIETAILVGDTDAQ
jgi:hypothetical protein